MVIKGFVEFTDATTGKLHIIRSNRIRDVTIDDDGDVWIDVGHRYIVSEPLEEIRDRMRAAGEQTQ